jgi:hypothetical protein
MQTQFKLIRREDGGSGHDRIVLEQSLHPLRAGFCEVM